MNKLIKALERALDKHNQAYYSKPERAMAYADQIMEISNELSERYSIGYVYCSNKWFNLDTYQFE